MRALTCKPLIATSRPAMTRQERVPYRSRLLRTVGLLLRPQAALDCGSLLPLLTGVDRRRPASLVRGFARCTFVTKLPTSPAPNPTHPSHPLNATKSIPLPLPRHSNPVVTSHLADGYTCRTKIAVSPSPSTKVQKLMDTLFAVYAPVFRCTGTSAISRRVTRPTAVGGRQPSRHALLDARPSGRSA